MDKVIKISEISPEGGTVTIEHIVGRDYYLVHLGNKQEGLAMSKADLVILQAEIAEILEN